MKQYPVIIFGLVLLLAAGTHAAAPRGSSQLNDLAARAAKAASARPPAGYKPLPPGPVRSTSDEWSIDLFWEASRDPFLSRYAIYTKNDTEDEATEPAILEKIAETTELSFREEGLEPDSTYSYWVTAVASNGAESDPVAIVAATPAVTRPPLEMDIIGMNDIFSNNYKIYETEGIGTLRIRNNTPDTISRLKVTFFARTYMDYPSEHEIRDIEPHESRTVSIKALLNTRVLDVLEDTPLQSELTLSYYHNGQLRSFSGNRTVMLHEKHRMVWKDRDMAALFVTPKDSPVLELSRSIAIQAGDGSGAAPLTLAGAVFQTLGALGITYVQDPSNPYQITSGKTDTVDYVQFPRETLQRKSGDCDDLVILYSALLESIGIRTMLLDYPGHMFMMFSVGKGSAVPDGELGGLLVLHDGELWAPLELTMVGSPFLRAWEKGARQYREWHGKGQLGRMDVQSAWQRYKPASLAEQTWRPNHAARQLLGKSSDTELMLLRRLSIQIASPALFKALQATPDDYRVHMQIGIRFGEIGDTDEAARRLERAAMLAPDNAEVINNLANVRLLAGKDEQALDLYRHAARLAPEDPYILTNMARCYLRLGNREAAKTVFRQAAGMQPEIAERFRGLALELLH